MRWSRSYRACFLAVLLTSVTTPELCLTGAKQTLLVAEKISSLRRCLREFPQDPLSNVARDNLISLLSASNRFEEALQEYRRSIALRQPSAEPDLKLLELLLKSGEHTELLRLTAHAPNNGKDFLFDQKLFELRVQAFLTQGRYRDARQCLDQWLGMHSKEGLKSSRFATEVRNLQQLRRYLITLEKAEGATGKALFTASVPDSLKRWSRRREVPVLFFKLVPTDAPHQTSQMEMLKSHTDDAFRRQINEANRGFSYISGNTFSVQFKESHTLYVKENDLDAPGSSSNLLASRVYVHTIPQLYRWAGRAFVILVDYRTQWEGEAAYMGDGIIHIAADKVRPMTLMHEILHGLGATHQEWNSLIHQGYRFDPEDRGLMTFSKGELRDLGLEEKNRILLDWPKVPTLRLPTEATDLSKLPF
jgi:tetratricopeptide (TPR) repeat protein